MSRQTNIQDAFNRAGYEGDSIIDFSNLYRLSSATIDVIAYPTYWNVMKSSKRIDSN